MLGSRCSASLTPSSYRSTGRRIAIFSSRPYAGWAELLTCRLGIKVRFARIFTLLNCRDRPLTRDAAECNGYDVDAELPPLAVIAVSTNGDNRRCADSKRPSPSLAQEGTQVTWKFKA